MKILLFLLVSIIYSQQEYGINQIVLQGDYYIKKYTTERVNGRVYSISDGMRIPLGKIYDGKKQGKWNIWNTDGTLNSIEYYKEGNIEKIEKYKEGYKVSEIIYKEPVEEIIQFDSNGNIKSKNVLKNGLPWDGAFPEVLTNDYVNDLLNIDYILLKKFYCDGVLEKYIYFSIGTISNSLDTLLVLNCVNNSNCLSKNEFIEQISKHLNVYKVFDSLSILITHNPVEVSHNEKQIFFLSNRAINQSKILKFEILFSNKSGDLVCKYDCTEFLDPNETIPISIPVKIAFDSVSVKILGIK
ncbi:MAG: hypothetical protein ACE5D8_04440 [Fidelibacterota bacterium]